LHFHCTQWTKYIKENDLQNPDKKTEIIPDDKMKKVFGPARFTVMRLVF